MKKLIILLTLLSAWALPGCDDKEYLYRDISSRIWLGAQDIVGNTIFTRDSAVSSFMLLPAGKQTDTLYLQANVTGLPATSDRKFVLQVVADSTNVPPSAYTVGSDFVIPANAFSVRIPVIVKRSVPGLDLTKQRAVLVFRFIPNENFLNGEPNKDMFRIVWYNFLGKPNSWTIVQPYLGDFSQAKYRFIIDVLGITEFTRFQSNTNILLALQSAMRKALKDYNENPANAGRPEGWPYRNDDGTPLTF